MIKHHMIPLTAFVISALVWADPVTGDTTAISSYGPRDAHVYPVSAAAPLGQRIDHDVPFVVQAPGAAWDNPILADACEEASVLMAVAWARQQPMHSESAVADITAMATYEESRFGTYVDTSAADTFALLREYEGLTTIELRYDISVDDLRTALLDGSIVILPVDGTILANPHYRDGGPPRHMLVLRGFDDATGAFIANDPGTQLGDGVAYDMGRVAAALRDYPTGDHLPVLAQRTAAIIVRQERP